MTAGVQYRLLGHFHKNRVVTRKGSKQSEGVDIAVSGTVTAVYKQLLTMV